MRDSAAAARREITIVEPPSLAPRRVLHDLARLARYSDLLYTLSLHRVRVRYKQSMLGLVWAIAQPLGLTVIYTLVFSRMARVPSEGMPYAVFAYTALLPWIYFSSGLTGATHGIVSNAQFVTKAYFPREILPLSYILAAVFDFIVGATVLAALMGAYGVTLTLHALWVVPIMLLATVFTTAVGLVLSALQVWLRDFGLALPLLLQVWMFATPIVYPLSIVPAAWRGWYILNPMVGIVENFRRVVLQGAQMEWSSFTASAVISSVLLVAGYIYFKSVDATMADVV
ncbi:MAG TPA: ABC transporter permease [Methylomirabilota bacterium]|jgi:lipopolysaccharide transport system permease protein